LASAVYDERLQVLISKIIWNGTLDYFEVFKNSFEEYYGRIGADYLFSSCFQEAYLDCAVDCYVNFLDDVTSASQIKKDARVLFSVILSSCHSGVGRRILMENRDKQDGIRS
jgi:hypothetical protein